MRDKGIERKKKKPTIESGTGMEGDIWKIMTMLFHNGLSVGPLFPL